MTFSFLYRAFCRVLQLIRLIGRSDTDLAIEVVMLRHEVAVLRRQIHRPALQPADRTVLAGLVSTAPPMWRMMWNLSKTILSCASTRCSGSLWALQTYWRRLIQLSS